MLGIFNNYQSESKEVNMTKKRISNKERAERLGFDLRKIRENNTDVETGKRFADDVITKQPDYEKMWKELRKIIQKTIDHHEKYGIVSSVGWGRADLAESYISAMDRLEAEVKGKRE